jgi:hypothetical protein
MSNPEDVKGNGDMQGEKLSEADGLQGSPKETGTERSEVEASGFKSHPRRLTEGSEPFVYK